jgi:hypothetical protein
MFASIKPPKHLHTTDGLSVTASRKPCKINERRETSVTPCKNESTQRIFKSDICTKAIEMTAAPQDDVPHELNRNKFSSSTVDISSASQVDMPKKCSVSLATPGRSAPQPFKVIYSREPLVLLSDIMTIRKRDVLPKRRHRNSIKRIMDLCDSDYSSSSDNDCEIIKARNQRINDKDNNNNNNDNNNDNDNSNNDNSDSDDEDSDNDEVEVIRNSCQRPANTLEANRDQVQTSTTSSRKANSLDIIKQSSTSVVSSISSSDKKNGFCKSEEPLQIDSNLIGNKGISDPVPKVSNTLNRRIEGIENVTMRTPKSTVKINSRNQRINDKDNNCNNNNFDNNSINNSNNNDNNNDNNDNDDDDNSDNDDSNHDNDMDENAVTSLTNAFERAMISKPKDQSLGNTPSNKISPVNTPSNKISLGNTPGDEISLVNTPSNKISLVNNPRSALKETIRYPEISKQNNENTSFNDINIINNGDIFSKEMKQKKHPINLKDSNVALFSAATPDKPMILYDKPMILYDSVTPCKNENTQRFLKSDICTKAIEMIAAPQDNVPHEFNRNKFATPDKPMILYDSAKTSHSSCRYIYMYITYVYVNIRIFILKYVCI